jgi:hypothetical protein
MTTPSSVRTVRILFAQSDWSASLTASLKSMVLLSVQEPAWPRFRVSETNPVSRGAKPGSSPVSPVYAISVISMDAKAPAKPFQNDGKQPEVDGFSHFLIRKGPQGGSSAPAEAEEKAKNSQFSGTIWLPSDVA